MSIVKQNGLLIVSWLKQCCVTVNHCSIYSGSNRNSLPLLAFLGGTAILMPDRHSACWDSVNHAKVRNGLVPCFSFIDYPPSLKGNCNPSVILMHCAETVFLFQVHPVLLEELGRSPPGSHSLPWPTSQPCSLGTVHGRIRQTGVVYHISPSPNISLPPVCCNTKQYMTHMVIQLLALEEVGTITGIL